MRRAGRVATAAGAIVSVTAVVVVGIAANLATGGSLPKELTWASSGALLVLSLVVSALLYRRSAPSPAWSRAHRTGEQLVAAVAQLEGRANDLLNRDLLINSETPTSLSRMRIQLVEQGVWTDDDLMALDAALTSRNAVVHGDIDQIDSVGLDEALASIERLTVKLEQWSARAKVPLAGRMSTLVGPTSGIRGLAFGPSGSWLVTAGDDATVRIWDVITGPVRVLAGHTDWVRGVAVAPDGTWLASASDDGTVRVWDAATGAQRSVLTGHTGGVFGVAIAPDGTWLASAGSDGTVRVWDAATGAQRSVLTGHTGGVFGVAIAPDGTWLATAGDDRIVRVWDVAISKPQAAFEGHTDRVMSVAIASDSAALASGGSDATVRLWDAVPALSAARPVMGLQRVAKLVDLLLNVEDIADPNVRTRVVSLLPEQIRAAVAYSPHPRVHLVGLIRASESFENGRDELLSALRMGLADSHELAEILPEIEEVLFAD
jgi:hypothetical protein